MLRSSGILEIPARQKGLLISEKGYRPVRSRLMRRRDRRAEPPLVEENTMVTAEDIFSPEGELARVIPGYTVRTEQLEMVRAIEEAIEGDRILIAEAGTGVGKSLAYLVPFILWALRENKRVVISTYTKALQNQLFVKDLPLLKEVLKEDLRYALCMGSQNYVCLRKARTRADKDLFDGNKEKGHTRKIREWLDRTDSGLITDMDFVPDFRVWNRFSRESDMCRGKRCYFYDDCFYMRARRQQSRAHLLVTNHSLLFSHLMSEARILPDFNGLVIDEAHTLEDVATSHLGRSFTRGRIHVLLRNVRAALAGIRPAGDDKGDGAGEIAEARSAGDRALGALESFFDSLPRILGNRPGSTQIPDDLRAHADIFRELSSLAGLLDRIVFFGADPEKGDDLLSYSRRCSASADDLDFILEKQNQEYVHWVDIRGKGKKTEYVFNAAPVDISGMMRAGLFEKISPMVLTSATLSSGPRSDFSYFRERTGLGEVLEIALDSPFDYGKNVLLYLPRSEYDPNRDEASFREHIFKNIVSIYEIMKGRMFALFTSYKMMNALSRRIRKERPDIEIHQQGELPRYVLLDVFKRSRTSILMGTTTFWQGVDVPGEPLECVIITRFPFAVPNDPVTSARIGAIRARGGDPFNEYQLPRAVLMFKQGFGRLIRSHSDRGVAAVLDPRINTRSYGRRFLQAVPDCRRTDNIEDIRAFFGK
ncbi:MAG: DEAD/DEAH box helicase [Candidatus Omnitrophica bacterium]|nr:DEAD/DEAH box helicase [Candidatus Omnitrophota bacterium]